MHTCCADAVYSDADAVSSDIDTDNFGFDADIGFFDATKNNIGLGSVFQIRVGTWPDVCGRGLFLTLAREYFFKSVIYH